MPRGASCARPAGGPFRIVRSGLRAAPRRPRRDRRACVRAVDPAVGNDGYKEDGWGVAPTADEDLAAGADARREDGESADAEAMAATVPPESPSEGLLGGTMLPVSSPMLALGVILAVAAAAGVAFKRFKGSPGGGGPRAQRPGGTAASAPASGGAAAPVGVKGLVPTAQERSRLEAQQRVVLNGIIDELRTEARVDLSGRNLMDDGVEFVAEGLAYNTVCRELRLSSNGISARACRQLAEVLKVNSTLQTLHLDTNRIDDECAALLAAALVEHTSLQRLNLASNCIGDVGATAIADCIKAHTSLMDLDLSGNEIDYKGAIAIATALTTNTSLRHLSVSDNYVSAMGVASIARALQKNSTLTDLSLRSCELGNIGVEQLCTALRERAVGLSSLDLKNNGITADGMAHVAELLQRQPLRRLVLAVNEAADDGAAALADGIAACGTLEELDLSGNGIDARGAKALAKALAEESCRLRVLALGYNPLGEAGVEAIVDVLKFDAPSLRVLRLGWCKIGDKRGAGLVGHLLQFNEHLEEVDLRGNDLGDNGGIAIGRSLKQAQNPRLRRLDLGNNKIRDDGVYTMCNAIKNNAEHMPDTIVLAQNWITKSGGVALKEALEDALEMYQKEMQIEF